MIRKFYDARDLFLGRDPIVKRNIREGIRLARDSMHSEGLWLCSIFDSCGFSEIADDTTIIGELKKRFLMEENALGYIYAGTVGTMDFALINKASELGNGFAMTIMSYIEQVPGIKYDFAKRSLATEERDAYTAMANCFEWGLGCNTDKNKASELYEAGAKLGDLNAALHFSRVCEFNDPRKYFWSGHVAQSCGHLIQFIYQILTLYGNHLLSPACIFQIGASYEEICAKNTVYQSFLTEVDQPTWERNVHMYCERALTMKRKWCELYKAATFSAAHVLKKLDVCKDLRKIISELIWSARFVPVYDIK